ncbi:unnamed protein product [Bursaphelenchus xylophilus]|uniref:N(6)-L-threonylcarbamoyladenine synthase n=1 Tax=Bursaphelenchus xylophilus TaxID=6326 RepID=A0A1I7RN74_BURXY|nr:unnamed protein product [Bursaphelenchus xylophilus]CAG9123719.1 unnamed protein product [Bursaphelenchus xylophilus]
MGFNASNTLRLRIARYWSLIHRNYTVLGIETSCDDTCAAILDSEKGILASRRDQNWVSQQNIGGISPFLAAQNHRRLIDRQVDEVLSGAKLRYQDLDGVAVSSEPGLVICLKVGVDKALAICRDNQIPFIPVHHMKAHALSARYAHREIDFPFVTLLISGGHSIIALAKDVDNFQVLGTSRASSPGETIDKVARTMGLYAKPHYGVQVESLASSSNAIMKYVTVMPSVCGADMDFASLRERFLHALRTINDININDFCCNLQHLVTAHLCQRLDVALAFVNHEHLCESSQKSLVIAGGVAANKYIRRCVDNVASHWGFKTYVPINQMVTDNAEMIAWTGIELKTRSSKIICPSELPLSFHVEAKSPLGEDISDKSQFAQSPIHFYTGK